MDKYTLVCNYTFQSGSHSRTITSVVRCLTNDKNLIIDFMRDARDLDVIFIINGHPLIEGEDKSGKDFPVQVIEKKYVPFIH